MKWQVINFIKWMSLLIFAALSTAVYFEVRDVTKLERFRRSDQPFPMNTKNPPSRFGLDNLHVSGSSRITQSSLKNTFSAITHPVYIFDLQIEPHYFIQGLPEHWYGYQRSEEIKQSLKGLKIKYVLRRLLKTKKLTHTKMDIQTEKDVVENSNFHYIGITQTRHRIPLKENVDHIIKILQTLPPNAWVHFHCSAGQGRTTIAMVMYDILKNGKKVPLADIVQRAFLQGSEDLFDTTVWKNGTYTKEMLENRKSFIVNFYRYVTDPKGLGIQSWKEWIQKQ
jgi:hypothetical protein